MLSQSLTVCIFAYNEEYRLLRCIRNFQERLQILVVDNYSTDNTRKIAQDSGCRVVSVKNPGFIETSSVMDIVQLNVHTDYLLIASVSEYIPINLLNKYSEIANNNSYDVVYAYRKSITAGLEIPISGPPSVRRSQLRFLKKGHVNYKNNKVHDFGRPTADSSRILKLSPEHFFFYQFRDYDCSKTELTMCRYNNILAKQMRDKKINFSLIKAIVASIKVFMTCFIRYRCFRFGVIGFLHSYYFAHNELTVWLRLWEHQAGFTHQEVISRNDKLRFELERELQSNA